MAIDPLVPTDPNAGVGSGTAGSEPAKGPDFLFHLLDIVNPLQHIPVISTIYRKMTGDEIAPAARLIGGGLFAGPIGLAVATANIVADGATGQDLGERTVALFKGKASEPALAQDPPPPDEPDGQEEPLSPAAKAEPVPPGFLATALTEADHAERSDLAAPPAPGFTAPPDLAQSILDALDKYQAMAREKNGLSAMDDEDEVPRDEL